MAHSNGYDDDYTADFKNMVVVYEPSPYRPKPKAARGWRSWKAAISRVVRAVAKVVLSALEYTFAEAV